MFQRRHCQQLSQRMYVRELHLTAPLKSQVSTQVPSPACTQVLTHTHTRLCQQSVNTGVRQEGPTSKISTENPLRVKEINLSLRGPLYLSFRHFTFLKQTYPHVKDTQMFKDNPNNEKSCVSANRCACQILVEKLCASSSERVSRARSAVTQG